MTQSGDGSQRVTIALLALLAGAVVFAARGGRHVPRPPEAKPSASAPPVVRPKVPVPSATLPGAAGEAQLINAAKVALRKGDTDTALAALDGYDKSFASGVLKEQAALVRIEALMKRGEPDKAAIVARPLLKNATSPVAGRARALLSGTPSLTRKP